MRDGADAAVPGVAVADTIKRVDGARVVATVDRDDLVAVQTPQAFRASALRAAHAAGGDATDDAALVEAARRPRRRRARRTAPTSRSPTPADLARRRAASTRA